MKRSIVIRNNWNVFIFTFLLFLATLILDSFINTNQELFIITYVALASVAVWVTLRVLDGIIGTIKRVSELIESIEDED